MDVFSTLTVRFHFNGQFINDGRNVHYIGGSEELSYIDRDKVSLAEVVGHLKDHCIVREGTLLHWLFPGKELRNGLRVLIDDNSCQDMHDAIVEGGVAEIYVEAPAMVEISESRDEAEKEMEKEPEEINSSSEDSDYLAGDDCSSEEDDEAADIVKKFKEFKKKMNFGERATLDDLVIDGANISMPAGFAGVEDEGNDTPYADSSDDEHSDEIGANGELLSKGEYCTRFKKTDGVPQFQLGMKFRSKKQFKKAIIRYGLAERRVINFIKDEPKRVRAKCDWPHCPWVFFKTNKLDDYIASCYYVEDFKKTYSYCLEPLEGMSNWPVSDRPPLKAPGYVRMPGRPKKERTRESTEAPKGTKMSKIGTTIRCTKCKQTGHNRSTCERHATTPIAIVPLSSTQNSCTSSKKRKAPAGPSKSAQKTIKTVAMATVSTEPGGSASVNLVANVPRSGATSSATINITSGKVTAQVSASAPTVKKSNPVPPKPGPRPMLLLPPWDSAKL